MFDYVFFEPLPIVKVHLIINCVLGFVAMLVVGLRLVSRFMSGAGLWWDDWLILAAVPQAIGMLIIQGLWLPMGIGYDMPETLPNLPNILKMLVAYELIYSVCISTVKLSVMIFYLRVFVNRGLRLAVKAALTFVGLWSTANVLQVFLICRPFPKTYTPTIEGECGDQIASFIAIGSFNIVTDVIIIALPLPTVWTLKMTTTAKLGLTGVFVIGLLVSVVAVLRIITLTELDLMNLTGSMIWADFWSTTEPFLAILCVSLPMLGSLWSRCLPSRRGASKLAYHSSDNNTNGSGFSKLKNPGGKEARIPLENIYAANQEVHYQSAIATAGTPEPDRDRLGYGDKDSGSEVALTDQDNSPSDTADGIRVQTKWAISHV